MTTYAFPSLTPNATMFAVVSNTSIFQSHLTGAIQTLDRGGEHWNVKIVFGNLKAPDSDILVAWLAKLNGRQHRFTLHNHAKTNRGAFGGTPLVAGASQTGNSINLDGCSFTITNWIREGDFFSIDNELKICTADASSDGAGLITVSFAPRLHAAPANNAVITTASATGVFMLDTESVSWNYRPGGFIDCSFGGIEDIVA
jgi:hypothetical protein